MRDVTPISMRCGDLLTCPAIIEVTPESMACMGGACPAIYEQEDGHIVIGKMMGEIADVDRAAMVAAVPESIRHRIGRDEFAVWVPKGLVQPGPGRAEPDLPKPVKVA